MNYRCFFGLFSLMCFLSQVRAGWRNDGMTTLRTELGYLNIKFEGYDIEKEDESFREEVCKKYFTARNSPILRKLDVGGIQDLNVETWANSDGSRNMKAFKCGSDQGKTFYCGKGPYRNQIAVYTLDEGEVIAEPFGIIEYEYKRS